MRKRMFNPEFFSDAQLVEQLDIAGRMFYLGLWTVAEDSGVFDLSPLALKMKIFPGDSIDAATINGYIEALVSIDKVIVFEANGRKYGWLKNFHKHQKLDRPSPPSLPMPEWLEWVPAEQRHKACYRIRQVGDESTTSRRHDDDESVKSGAIEEKGKEEKKETDYPRTHENSKDTFADPWENEWLQSFHHLPSTGWLIRLVEYRDGKGLSGELITLAIQLARAYDAQTPEWVEKALESWSNQGIKTVEDYFRNERARKKELGEARRQAASARDKPQGGGRVVVNHEQDDDDLAIREGLRQAYGAVTNTS